MAKGFAESASRCGPPIPLFQRFFFLSLVLILALSTLSAGCSGISREVTDGLEKIKNEKNGDKGNKTPLREFKPTVDVIRSDARKLDKNKYLISGAVKNSLEKKAVDVKVAVRMIDYKNKTVGSATIPIGEIRPGQEKGFRGKISTIKPLPIQMTELKTEYRTE